MSTMSTGTIAFPRPRPRTSARPSARPHVSRAERGRARDAGGARRSSGRGVGPRGAADRRRPVSERAARTAKWARVDALEFASRHRAPLLALLAVVLFALFFYGPVKGLYQAWRTEGVRQEQLAELSLSNEAYQQEIDRLQTREGIEDEARRRGYVAEGETSIVVEGLEGMGEDADAAAADDTPWYLRVADFIFQYEAR